MRTNQVIAAIQSISMAGNIEANVARHARLARIAAMHGATFALFPELSLTGYELAIAHEVAIRQDDVRLAELRAVARETDMTIAAGAPIAGEDGKVYIAALSFRPDGQMDCYTKQHLHEGEARVFAAGEGGEAMDIHGQKIALAVCADISHASHPRRASEDGACIYAASVLVSESGYATDSGLLEQYAKEHAMLVVMANHGGATGGWRSAGRSAIWDRNGELVVAAPADGECIVWAAQESDGWSGQVLSDTLGYDCR